METSTLEKQTRTIPIEQIVCDENIRARDHDDPDHVLRISRTDPSIWPPLIVTQRANGYFALLDGFHRLAAGMRLGMTQFECDVITPEGDSEYLTSVVSNLGPRALPLSKSDRKIFSIFLHEEYPELSARKIADKVGLAPSTVLIAWKAESGNSKPKPAQLPKFLNALVKVGKEGGGILNLGDRRAYVAKSILKAKNPDAIIDALDRWLDPLIDGLELAREKLSEKEE